MAVGGGNKAIITALLANAGIAVAKFVGFLITRSSSMLAESIHSAADTGNQGLLLLGGNRARREASISHPFGHGRERYFWAFVVSVVLFLGGSAFAIFEGIEKLRHPHELDAPAVALAILGLGIVLEGFAFRTAIGEANKVRGDASWVEFVRRSRSPELPVVLLEDLGATIGLVIAFFCITMATVTGVDEWDGAGTLTIGILLGIIAIVLAVEMKSLLIGESATARHRDAIVAAIESHPDVQSLIHLRTQHIGPEELLVAAKVDFRPDLSVPELAAAVDDLEHRVRTEVTITGPMYVEPDIRQAVTPG